LKNLLEKKYLKYLIDPEISIRIKTFKEQRILVTGEVRNPGIYKFAPYTSLSFSPDIYLPKNDKKLKTLTLVIK